MSWFVPAPVRPTNAEADELRRIVAGQTAPVGATAVRLRWRLARMGLARLATRMDDAGLEVDAGWRVTAAGCSALAALEAEARDARGAAQEVADGVRLHRPRPPGHDYQQGR